MHKPEQRTTCQRVEYCNGEVVELYCPYCGSLVIPGHIDIDTEPAPCPHTLYIATDEGFEHRSSVYDQLMDIEGVSDDELDLGEASVDAYTDALEVPIVLKFALYTPAPSFMGLYVGFAPIPVE